MKHLFFFTRPIIHKRNNSGFRTLYFLSQVVTMLCGLKRFTKSKYFPNFSIKMIKCLGAPMLIVCQVVCLIDCNDSGSCILMFVLIFLWGIMCNFTASVIIDGNIRHLHKSQYVYAGIILQTFLFSYSTWKTCHIHMLNRNHYLHTSLGLAYQYLILYFVPHCKPGN